MNTINRFPTFLIDGVFFQLGSTGIARVWLSLLREWAANGFAEQLLVLDRGDTMPRLDGIRYRTIPPYDYRTSGEDAIRLQALCDEEQAAAFISTYYTTPLTTPSVFLAYDMIPEVYDHELASPMWREKHLGVQHASAHVAISRSTARDLAKFFPQIDANAVTVAYPGVEATFHPPTAAEVEQFRERRDLRKPYFLLVGSRRGFNGYKNALLFFQALTQLPERERFAVVCTGGEATLETEFQPFAADGEPQLLQLSDDELRAAYGGAVALVYVSRYEGFGLPVLEAMACGCPVITCRNSSLVEVAGEAALFIPETEVGALVTALQRMQREGVRQSLIAGGLQQAAKFSWIKMATTLTDVLRRTAEAKRPPLRLWPEFRRVQAREQTIDALLGQLRRTEYERDLVTLERDQTALERDQVTADRDRLRAELWKTAGELGTVKTEISQMQTSKFWRMRIAMLNSKDAMRQLAGRWLPRQAG